MSSLPVQDACGAVKAAMVELESAIKTSQKLGTLKAKPQVDLILKPLMVRIALFVLVIKTVQANAWSFLVWFTGVGRGPHPCPLGPTAPWGHDYDLL
jgi:hypothetical protein